MKQSFHTVCGGGKSGTKSVKVEYKLIEMTPRTLVVKEAFKSVEKKLYKDGYNLLVENCEHFARGLVEGGKEQILQDDYIPHGRSKQVQLAQNIGTGLGVVSIVAAKVLLGTK